MSSWPSPRSMISGRLVAHAAIWVKPCHTTAPSRSTHSSAEAVIGVGSYCRLRREHAVDGWVVAGHGPHQVGAAVELGGAAGQGGGGGAGARGQGERGAGGGGNHPQRTPHPPPPFD